MVTHSVATGRRADRRHCAPCSLLEELDRCWKFHAETSLKRLLTTQVTQNHICILSSSPVVTKQGLLGGAAIHVTLCVYINGMCIVHFSPQVRAWSSLCMSIHTYIHTCAHRRWTKLMKEYPVCSKATSGNSVLQTKSEADARSPQAKWAVTKHSRGRRVGVWGWGVVRLRLTMDQRYKLELAYGEISSIIFRLSCPLLSGSGCCDCSGLNVLSSYNDWKHKLHSRLKGTGFKSWSRIPAASERAFVFIHSSGK